MEFVIMEGGRLLYYLFADSIQTNAQNAQKLYYFQQIPADKCPENTQMENKDFKY
jgi:hypothetical protein